MARAYKNLHVLVFIRQGNLLLLLLYSVAISLSLRKQTHRHWQHIPRYLRSFHWLSPSFVLVFLLAYILYRCRFVVWIVATFLHHIFIVSCKTIWEPWLFFLLLHALLESPFSHPQGQDWCAVSWYVLWICSG